jgi:hypothetical protein
MLINRYIYVESPTYHAPVIPSWGRWGMILTAALVSIPDHSHHSELRVFDHPEELNAAVGVVWY